MPMLKLLHLSELRLYKTFMVKSTNKRLCKALQMKKNKKLGKTCVGSMSIKPQYDFKQKSENKQDVMSCFIISWFGNRCTQLKQVNEEMSKTTHDYEIVGSVWKKTD